MTRKRDIICNQYLEQWYLYDIQCLGTRLRLKSVTNVSISIVTLRLLIIVLNKSGIARTTTKSACPINYCQNGGTCFQTSSQKGYTCACPDSYTGHTCETGEYSTLYKNYQWIYLLKFNY